MLRTAAKFLKERAPVTGFELTGQVVKLEALALAQGGNVTVAGLVDDAIRQVQFPAGPDDYRRAIKAHRHERIVSVEGELVKDGRSFRLNNPRMFSVALADQEWLIEARKDAESGFAALDRGDGIRGTVDEHMARIDAAVRARATTRAGK